MTAKLIIGAAVAAIVVWNMIGSSTPVRSEQDDAITEAILKTMPLEPKSCLLMGLDAKDIACRIVQASVERDLCDEAVEEYQSDRRYDLEGYRPQRCMRYGYKFQ
ncbi:hypothetical protein [Rhizobium sp. RAF56]|uniref:hypothetical protein n=1 Tax=Rhizobium sp. RAF56 TaxID=3233062 RepID=UPI003F966127